MKAIRHSGSGKYLARIVFNSYHMEYEYSDAPVWFNESTMKSWSAVPCWSLISGSHQIVVAE